MTRSNLWYVQQRHSDHANPEIGRGPQSVAGQNPSPPEYAGIAASSAISIEK